MYVCLKCWYICSLGIRDYSKRTGDDLGLRALSEWLVDRRVSCFESTRALPGPICIRTSERKIKQTIYTVTVSLWCCDCRKRIRQSRSIHMRRHERNRVGSGNDVSPVPPLEFKLLSDILLNTANRVAVKCVRRARKQSTVETVTTSFNGLSAACSAPISDNAELLLPCWWHLWLVFPLCMEPKNKRSVVVFFIALSSLIPFGPNESGG